MNSVTRREFLRTTAMGMAAAGAGPAFAPGWAQPAGERPVRGANVTVLNPCDRVPISLIIDDSTCLVNLAHFAIPQFAEVFPDRYRQDWKKLPREIPDAFVRKFGEWCQEKGVKGKYSLVPYPACAGWLDRDLPGWSKQELRESLALVRNLLTPNWDFHPEMISHTWALDTKTGRPYPERTEAFMENWGFSVGKSVDQLTDYLSYALRILKNVDIPCEGITTPGGFGSRARPELAQATLLACREVFQAEIPHYFRDLYDEGDRSVAPLVHYASGLGGADPRCVVSIIGCTGDWFGGWDGLERGSADRFITADLQRGRMVDVIRRGEPAIIVCHWPGVYFNGEEVGFNIFKEVVHRLHAAFDNLVWLKLSEIARYWAAKELTCFARDGDRLRVEAPFACPQFTLRLPAAPNAVPRLSEGATALPLREVSGPRRLQSGTWTRQGQDLLVCFDLRKGRSELTV